MQSQPTVLASPQFVCSLGRAAGRAHWHPALLHCPTMHANNMVVRHGTVTTVNDKYSDLYRRSQHRHGDLWLALQNGATRCSQRYL